MYDLVIKLKQRLIQRTFTFKNIYIIYFISLCIKNFFDFAEVNI